MYRVGVKRSNSETGEPSEITVLPPAKRIRASDSSQQSTRSPSLLWHLSFKLWGAVDYVRKKWSGWRRSLSPSPSPPPPVTTTVQTQPASQTARVEDEGGSAKSHNMGLSEGHTSLHTPTPAHKLPEQHHFTVPRVKELPLKETLQRSSQSKPSVLRERRQARDREQYNQILYGHTSSPSSSPARSPSLFTPLLHPEVIGPTSPRDTVAAPSQTFNTPRFHSTPFCPTSFPCRSSISSHPPVPDHPTPSHTLSSPTLPSHHPRNTSMTTHSHTLPVPCGGKQPLGKPPQHPQWKHYSHHGPSHLYPHEHTLTTSSLSNRGVQTSPAMAILPLEPIVSLKRLDTLKQEHKYAMEDRKALGEVLENYVRVNREDRQKVEKERVEKMRRKLGLLAMEEPAVKEMDLELTAEQKQKIAAATGRGSSSDCLSERFRIRIARSDMFTLTGLQWLNDEIINFYFNLIAERSGNGGKRKAHVMSSFFYPKLCSAGYSGVRRWTKKVDVFAHDIILIPIHLGMHWCLATIHFRQQQFQYFDSLGGNNLSCFNRLRDYLVAEARDKKQMEYDISNWTNHNPKNIPNQENGSDCGVFTCMYARHIASGVPFTFSQRDMPKIREHMICEILEQRLF